MSIINYCREGIKQKLKRRKLNNLKIRIEREVSEVLVSLGNPLVGRFNNPIADKVMLIHYAIDKKSKYSKVEKLTPLIIYIFLTLRDFPVNKSDLIQVSKIFYEEFNCFFYQFKNYLLNYYQRDDYV